MISLEWVKDYIDISDQDLEELAVKITQSGINVEKVITNHIDNLVIGEVIECVDHPNSDHLHICKVDIGNSITQIVCGAANVRAGIKVIVALPGCVLGDNEIKKGNIKEKVVVQAGCTNYESDNMEIFDLIPSDEFDDLVARAGLIITHGGAGSILTAIKKNKKVIAAARLKKYKEHTNDHQIQIVKEFAKDGYILELRDFSKLGKLIAKSKTFKPKKFVSNTPNMVKIIDDYIEKSI